MNSSLEEEDNCAWGDVSTDVQDLSLDEQDDEFPCVVNVDLEEENVFSPQHRPTPPPQASPRSLKPKVFFSALKMKPRVHNEFSNLNPSSPQPLTMPAVSKETNTAMQNSHKAKKRTKQKVVKRQSNNEERHMRKKKVPSSSTSHPRNIKSHVKKTRYISDSDSSTSSSSYSCSDSSSPEKETKKQYWNRIQEIHDNNEHLDDNDNDNSTINGVDSNEIGDDDEIELIDLNRSYESDDDDIRKASEVTPVNNAFIVYDNEEKVSFSDLVSGEARRKDLTKLQPIPEKVTTHNTKANVPAITSNIGQKMPNKRRLGNSQVRLHDRTKQLITQPQKKWSSVSEEFSIRKKKLLKSFLSKPINDFTELSYNLSFSSHELSSPKTELVHIPLTFKNPNEYYNSFERHLFEECFSIIKKGLDQREFDSEKVQVKKLPDSNLALEYHDFIFSFPTDYNMQSSSIIYSASDLLIVKCITVSKTYSFLGCILPSKEKSTSRQNPIFVRCQIDQFGVTKSSILKGTRNRWEIQKICSLSNIFKAMEAIHLLDYCPHHISSTILHPSKQIVRQLNRSHVELSPVYEEFLRKNFNKSQIEAINHVYSHTEGITLIQGPPGTGKTRTICGLICILLRNNTYTPNQQNILITNQEKLLSLSLIPEPSNQRVLLCAPSNSSLDEVILKIKKYGLINPKKERYQPNIVRIGVKDRVNEGVADQYLDNLIKKEIEMRKKSLHNKYAPIIENWRGKQEDTKRGISNLKRREKMLNGKRIGKLSETAESTQQNIRNEINKLQLLLNSLDSNIDNTYKEWLQEQKNMKDIPKIRSSLLLNADIICSTLGSMGNDRLPPISCCIIDESCQAVEPETIVPIVASRAKNIVLVGDPQQLPATVISLEASKYNYQQSLMDRLIKAEYPVIMLDVQYRMHPEIRKFPSDYFYKSRLKDGGTNIQTRGDYIYKAGNFPAFWFYDIMYGKEQLNPKYHSLANIEEVKFIISLINKLFQSLKKRYNTTEKLKNNIGIISPYKEQVKLMKSRLLSEFGETPFKEIAESIEIYTVDGFQGKEKDVIIFSCVRSEGEGIGFLRDIRRLNVGLTRAKCCLWVVGNSKQLKQSDVWSHMIESAKDRGMYTPIHEEPPNLSSSRQYQEKSSSTSISTISKSSSTSAANETLSHPVIAPTTETGKSSSTLPPPTKKKMRVSFQETTSLPSTRSFPSEQTPKQTSSIIPQPILKLFPKNETTPSTTNKRQKFPNKKSDLKRPQGSDDLEQKSTQKKRRVDDESQKESYSDKNQVQIPTVDDINRILRMAREFK